MKWCVRPPTPVSKGSRIVGSDSKVCKAFIFNQIAVQSLGDVVSITVVYLKPRGSHVGTLATIMIIAHRRSSALILVDNRLSLFQREDSSAIRLICHNRGFLFSISLTMSLQMQVTLAPPATGRAHDHDHAPALVHVPAIVPAHVPVLVRVPLVSLPKRLPCRVLVDNRGC